MADDVDLTEMNYDFLDLGDPVVDEGLPNGILIAFRSMGSWMVVNHESADTHAGKSIR